jgi:hypothetical protein
MIIPRNTPEGSPTQQERMMQRMVNLYFLEWLLKADYGRIVEGRLERKIVEGLGDLTDLKSDLRF